MAASKVGLSADDKIRMRRLYGEMQGLLAQMGAIGIRVMQEHDPEFRKVVEQGKPTHQFRLRPDLPFQGTEFICFGSGDGMCLCHDYDEGTCSRC